MHSYEELAYEYMQDSWSDLFAIFASVCVEKYGQHTQDIMRRTSIGFADDVADRYLDSRSSELPCNVLNLAELITALHSDPRFHEHIGAQEADKLIIDVYACPIAKFWNKTITEELAETFCEEFYSRLSERILGQNQQSNLSKILCRDKEHTCQFSFYCRKANQAQKVQENFDDSELLSSICIDSEDLRWACVRLIDSFYDSIIQYPLGEESFRYAMEIFIENELNKSTDIIGKRGWEIGRNKAEYLEQLIIFENEDDTCLFLLHLSGKPKKIVDSILENNYVRRRWDCG